MDTLAEEEGLRYTAVFTLFDADTDLWHTGSREPLSQRGPVNQGHFVGFRHSKELHIYNCAWSQPPSSPRRQHHLVEIKQRTFPNSWPALVLSFNNRMNGFRAVEGIKKRYARLPETPSPTTLFPCKIRPRTVNQSTLKRSLALFTQHRWLPLRHLEMIHPAETWRKSLKSFRQAKKKKKKRIS